MLSILRRNAKFILTQANIFGAAYYVAKGDFGHLAMMSTLWFLLLIATVVAIMLEKDSPKDPEG
jgi:hypothetical protein